MPFHLIPALDLKGGQAVHAIGGRRAHYEPLRSILHPSADPIAVARAFRDSLGLRTLYLADLDAIGGSRPDTAVLGRLVALGLHIWVDAGVRGVQSLAPLLEIDRPSCSIVAGLETIGGPSALAGILELVGGQWVIFSVDLFDGHPRAATHQAWASDDPAEIALEAIHIGARALLLIDLARVGTGRGSGTETLLARIRQAAPEVSVYVGGGISSIDEVVRLRDAGAGGVLVSSALHDGRIGGFELALLEASDPASAQRDL